MEGGPRSEITLNPLWNAVSDAVPSGARRDSAGTLHFGYRIVGVCLLYAHLTTN